MENKKKKDLDNKGAECCCCEDCGCEKNADSTANTEDKATEQQIDEVSELKKQIDSKAKQCEDMMNLLQRTAAEFDNFKKRTAKEKEAIYSDAVSDVISAFLPVIDNLERAKQSADAGVSDTKSIKEGIDLVIKQLNDVLKSMDVKVIKSVGETFDPQFHNAVMHTEDDSCGHSIVLEEFQKGYIYKEKVIRYSMVKVAN